MNKNIIKSFFYHKGAITFLKVVIISITLVVLGIGLYMIPEALNIEEVGPYLPIVIGIYLSSIPVFLVAIQIFKLLNFIDNNKAFSEDSIKSLNKIKLLAFSFSLIYIVGSPYIYFRAEKDDAPGVFAMGLIIISASFVFGVIATVLEKLVKNALEIKSENDLTV